MGNQNNTDSNLGGHEGPALGRRRLLKAAGFGVLAAPVLASMAGCANTADHGSGLPPAAPAPSKVNAAAAGQIRIGGDLTVNRLGYGTLQLTGPGKWGEPQRRDEALQILCRAPELGVNFIDTAEAYGPYVAESLVAEALSPYPQGLTVATKAGLIRPDEVADPWPELGDPNYLNQAIRMSQRRLKVDRIDLWQLHRVDPKVPEIDQYTAMRSFLDKGLARHVGLSEVSIAQIEAARKVFPVASVQNRYNLNYRKHEDVLNYCEANGITFIPWFPLANGDLTKPGGPADALAKAKGSSPAQIAIAWLLKRSPVMLPIPGTSRLAHFEENVAAAGITLTDAEFAELDRATQGNR